MFPGYCRICKNASAKVVQTCVENMIHERFFHLMNATIATFLKRHNLKCSINFCMIRCLICGCDFITFTNEPLEKIGGYSFIQRDELDTPNFSITVRSPLEKFVWRQTKMLRDGGMNSKNSINVVWV